MALKDYGKAEHDPGAWVDFGIDKPFRLRVRRIPPDVWEEIDRRHRGKDSFEVRDGIRRRVQDQDVVVAALTDKAIFAWVDAEGLEVDIEHEDAAKLWTGLLGREVAVGSRLSLTGESLNASVKRRIFAHLKPIARVEDTDEETGQVKVDKRDIASFIVLEAARLQSEFASAREEEQKNS